MSTLAPEPSAPPPRRRRRRIARWGRVNFALVVGMILVAGWSSLGHDLERLRPLLISLWPATSPEALSEVRAGAVWRLFTPIFVHFGLLHLGLNLLAMMTLCEPLERVLGSRFYALFAAAVALASNLGQYFVSGQGNFGGMSGVIFGWFGFVLLRARLDRRFLLELHPWSIVLTMVCFGVGLSNVLPIANTAHAVGLGIGLLCGAVTGRRAATIRAAEMPAAENRE